MTINKNGKLIINALFLVLLVAGLLWLGTTIYSAAQLPIQRVKIEGSFAHIEHDEIADVVLPYVQGGFFSIDVTRLKDRLQQLSWLKYVTVSRRWPDTVMIKVTEQQAIAHWQKKHLINQDGEVFDASGHDVSADLPWLFGPDGQAEKVLKYYKKMNVTLQHLGLHIRKIELTKRQAWTLVLDNDMKLKLGRLTPIRQLTRFVQAYNPIFGSKGSSAQFVDLRYPNGIAVRWKKEKV